jgi:hypothetical protein
MNRFHFICFAFIYLAVSSCKSPGKNSKKIIDSKNLKKTSTITDTIKPVKIDESDLKALVDTLNDYLTSYDTIHSMSAYSRQDMQKLKLTKSDIDTLMIDADEDHNVRGFMVAEYYQGYIDDLISKVLSHPKIIKYDLNRILQNIGVTKSDDGKIYDLILPENTGGSYRSNFSYLHYRAENGKIYNFSLTSLKDDSTRNKLLNQDGADTIYTLQTKHGPKYLLYGSVQGCNTCIGEYIQLIHFDSKGKLYMDFSFSTGERMNYDNDNNEDPQGISYDDQKKEIIMKHNANDDQLCDCRTDAQKENNADLPNLRIGKKMICVFKFNGDTFVLDKKRSRSLE